MDTSSSYFDQMNRCYVYGDHIVPDLVVARSGKTPAQLVAEATNRLISRFYDFIQRRFLQCL